MLETKTQGVYISTYGCQMNVNDTDRMYSLLEMANFVPVKTPEEASVIIINSCSIREKPVHKVYSEVGTYRKLKENNPNLKIGIGGCVGQQEKEKLIQNQPMIDFVFGTDSIDTLPELVLKAVAQTPKEKKKKNLFLRVFSTVNLTTLKPWCRILGFRLLLTSRKVVITFVLFA